jgi:hypothetical protein
MGKRRQTDGTYRGPRQIATPSARTIRARWGEEEVLKLKILGVPTFQAIAQQITKVGRGEARPMVEFPPGIEFPTNYTISSVACWRACRRALARGPRLRAQEMRDLDTDRLEEGILAAQKGVKAGNPAALQNLTRLVLTRARINGYLAPQKMELSGKSGGPLEVKQTEDSEIKQMLERLTPEEQVEFMRLFNKARGNVVESSEITAEGREADAEENQSKETDDEEDDGGSDPTVS